MQIIARRILFLIAVFAAVPALAGNIGFLDTDRAIKTVKEGQRQMRVLDDWSNQKSDEVEAIRNRVNEIAGRLETQRTIASDDVIRGLEDELLRAQRAFEDAGRSLQRDFEAKQRELLEQVAIRVRDVAGEYAAVNGFDAIFVFETTPLVYVAESAVITDAVIQLYDQRFPVD